MTTYLGKSCSFGLPRVPFVNCRRFMYLVISLLVYRAGCGIWLYQFLIIAYLFTFHEKHLVYLHWYEYYFQQFYQTSPEKQIRYKVDNLVHFRLILQRYSDSTGRKSKNKLLNTEWIFIQSSEDTFSYFAWNGYIRFCLFCILVFKVMKNKDFRKVFRFFSKQNENYILETSVNAADYEVTACYCMKILSELRKLSILLLVLSEYRTNYPRYVPWLSTFYLIMILRYFFVFFHTVVCCEELYTRAHFICNKELQKMFLNYHQIPFVSLWSGSQFEGFSHLIYQTILTLL